MTTTDHPTSPRFIWRKLLLAALLVVFLFSLPAAWLIARDMMGVQFASTVDQRRVGGSAIIDGLMYEIDRADSIDGADALAAMSFNQPCYSVAMSSVRKNERFLPSAISRSGDYDINSQMVSVEVAASFHVRRSARYLDAKDKFSPFAASVLRACIAATPFGKTCLDHATDVLGRSAERFNQQSIEWGLQVPIRSTPSDRHQRFCRAVPMFVGSESQ